MPLKNNRAGEWHLPGYTHQGHMSDTIKAYLTHRKNTFTLYNICT